MTADHSSRWAESLSLGIWQANCYLLGDHERGEAIVVDPGQGALDRVIDVLAAHHSRCVAILLTHGHLDHLWSAPELAVACDAPVLLHPDDAYLWKDPSQAFGAMTLTELERDYGLKWEPDHSCLETFDDGAKLRFAGYEFTARHTPGHTPGSSVFLLTDPGADDPVLLSGDLIFAGSVGRTDFPKGSTEELMASIARVVLPLEDHTVIRSGHGADTTVGKERATNPFLTRLTAP